MITLESLKGCMVEINTLHCPPLHLVIEDVDAETVSGRDDDGVLWMIRRTSIVIWREAE